MAIAMVSVVSNFAKPCRHAKRVVGNAKLSTMLIIVSLLCQGYFADSIYDSSNTSGEKVFTPITHVSAVQLSMGIKKCNYSCSSIAAPDYYADDDTETPLQKQLRCVIQKLPMADQISIMQKNFWKVKHLKSKIKGPAWAPFDKMADSEIKQCIINAGKKNVRDCHPEAKVVQAVQPVVPQFQAAPAPSALGQPISPAQAFPEPDPPTKSLPYLRERQELNRVFDEINRKVHEAGITGSVGLDESPKLILVGHQSVGKSRILETLAGQPFTFVDKDLGSTRPTELQFKSTPGVAESRWLRERDGKWEEVSKDVLQRWLELEHNQKEPGTQNRIISSQKLRVRFESPHTCDMTIVDLPGKRTNPGTNKANQKIKQDIDKVLDEFINDEKTTMLCVEEAGPGVTMNFSVNTCLQAPKGDTRTMIVRNKLDALKQEHLDRDWLSGKEWVPENIDMYAVTCPHWDKDAFGHMREVSPEAFRYMKKEKSDADESRVRRVLGMGPASAVDSDRLASKVGFYNFERSLTRKMVAALIESVPKVEQELLKREGELETDLRAVESSISQLSVENLDDSVERASLLFGMVVKKILNVGFDEEFDQFLPAGIASHEARPDLKHELEIFNREYYENILPNAVDAHGAFKSEYVPEKIYPCEELKEVEDYAANLEEHSQGSWPMIRQFRSESTGSLILTRLLDEVEHFLKFAEANNVITMSTMSSICPGDSIESNIEKFIVAAVRKIGMDSLLNGVKYAGQRMVWFFSRMKYLAYAVIMKEKPKDPFIQDQADTMTSVRQLLSGSTQVRDMLFKKWDMVVEKQRQEFVKFSEKTLKHVFQDPWSLTYVFMDHGLHKDVMKNIDTAKQTPDIANLIDYQGTVARVKQDTARRVNMAGNIEGWKKKIRDSNGNEDEVSRAVYGLSLELFKFVRADAVSQIRRHAKTMFEIPLTDSLFSGMKDVQVARTEQEVAAVRQEADSLKAQKDQLMSKIAVVKECQADLTKAKKDNHLMQGGAAASF